MLGFTLLLSLSASSFSAVINNNIDHTIWSLSEELDKTELTRPIELKFVGDSLEDKTVDAGSELELRCEVAGIPTPIVMWYFNGQLIDGNYETTVYEKLHNVGKPTIQNGITASKLRIPCADKANKGRYKCVALTGQQKIEKVARVTVVGSSVCQLAPEAPVIHMWSDGRFENEGNAVQLLCRATKGAQIAWYNEDRELLNDRSGYEVAPTGDLVIKKADWEHMGQYTCIASNSFGEDRASIFFYPTALETTSKL